MPPIPRKGAKDGDETPPQSGAGTGGRRSLGDLAKMDVGDLFRRKRRPPKGDQPAAQPAAGAGADPRPSGEPAAAAPAPRRRSLSGLAKLDIGDVLARRRRDPAQKPVRGQGRRGRRAAEAAEAEAGVAPAVAEPKRAPRERRSAGSLAKMDVGDLLGLLRRSASSRGARRSPRAGAPVVGVNIEPGYLVAAQVVVNGGLRVERAGAVELAPEVVRDGEVVDALALATALRTLFGEHKLDRRVRLGIANQRIVVRMLELPPITDPRELEAAVRFQAQEELPMALDSAVIDYEPLGIVEGAAGPRQRVVLVAARREMIERLVAAAREAGLRPEGIDLSAFALIRALHISGVSSQERVAYLSVGGLGNLAVAAGLVCEFTRVLSVGLESIAGDVAERLGVGVGDARAMVLRAALRPERPLGAWHDPDALPEQHAGGGGASEDEIVVGDVVADGVRRIAVEIRNSLHYHSMHGGDQPVTRLVVSGAMTAIGGFVDALAAELELDVQVANVSEARAGGFGAVPVERLAIAAGLAVSEVPA